MPVNYCLNHLIHLVDSLLPTSKRLEDVLKHNNLLRLKLASSVVDLGANRALADEKVLSVPLSL